MILPCTCNSDFQDKQYGMHNRVHNEMKTGGKYKCTVCGNIHIVSSKIVAETKKGDK